MQPLHWAAGVIGLVGFITLLVVNECEIRREERSRAIIARAKGE